ncbi:hypothetical protein [Thiocapsa rosea]|uniref:hypothetical protein n=1 Tax=Thiocapsa rosea TaxID=69360 RepID=UPI000EACDD37|nr:hypothetical protein [Thiocapsa rosea]
MLRQGPAILSDHRSFYPPHGCARIKAARTGAETHSLTITVAKASTCAGPAPVARITSTCRRSISA